MKIGGKAFFWRALFKYFSITRRHITLAEFAIEDEDTVALEKVVNMSERIVFAREA